MVKMNYRHGDLALKGIEELPEGLKAGKDKELMKGSHGNSHGFTDGVFYPKKTGQNVLGYFEAKEDCKLLHLEHGCAAKGRKLKETEIKVGIYEVRGQVEDTHAGMKPVVD
jgi:hypothetical protein